MSLPSCLLNNIILGLVERRLVTFLSQSVSREGEELVILVIEVHADWDWRRSDWAIRNPINWYHHPARSRNCIETLFQNPRSDRVDNRVNRIQITVAPESHSGCRWGGEGGRVAGNKWEEESRRAMKRNVFSTRRFHSPFLIMSNCNFRTEAQTELFTAWSSA